MTNAMKKMLLEKVHPYLDERVGLSKRKDKCGKQYSRPREEHL